MSCSFKKYSFSIPIFLILFCFLIQSCGPVPIKKSKAENKKAVLKSLSSIKNCLNNIKKGGPFWEYKYSINQNLLSSDENKNITIFLAGSLILPLSKIAEKFEMLYPGIKINIEASGSRIAARKITELNRQADIFFSADYNVIKNLMFPDFAHYSINFSAGEMVIVYTDRSKFSNEINNNNWYKILLSKEVRFGRSDPECDPAGYRTLIVWKLADIFCSQKNKKVSIYDSLLKKCSKKNIRPGSIQLLPLLESLWLDYCFEYKSVAEQHNLKYLKLPEEINLSSGKYNKEYKKAVIQIRGRQMKKINMKGESIIYSFTVCPESLHKKIIQEFIKFFFSQNSAIIFKNHEQPLISPQIIDFTNDN